jgi:hypothetical protein
MPIQNVQGRKIRLERFLTGLAVLAAALSLLQALRPVWTARADGAATRNPIDTFVLARLEQEKIAPSPMCSDEEFIRRAWLDVCGSIPPRAETSRFLADNSPAKRASLIDKLLDSERHAEHWAVLWGDLLREHSNSKPREGTERGSYREWIKEALRRNMPYDQFARELIIATGSPDENGAVNFYLRDENNRVETVNTVATVFMGTRMACAQCHDHPFDKWTQKDFHTLAAYFSRVNVVIDPVQSLLRLEENKRLPDDVKKMLAPYFAEAHEAEKREATEAKLGGLKDGSDNSGANMGMMSMSNMNGKARSFMKEIDEKLTKEQAQKVKQIVQQSQVRQVLERPNGDYRMPAEGDGAKKSAEVVPAVFPWNPARKSSGPGSRRRALADALVSERQFAAVQANRLWAQLMGCGIVDPIDDFREKNPPTHPELLDYLTTEFIKAKFDNKHILRLILNSSTYQRAAASTESNKADNKLYSHRRLRRMSAEQIFDSVLIATGRENGLDSARLLGRDMLNAPKGPNGAKIQDIQWAADLPTPARTGTFLSTFNQPTREQITVQRPSEGSIAQALEMLNGRAVNDAIRNSPLIASLLERKATAGEALAELYLSMLTRTPGASEKAFATKLLQTGQPSREWLEDLCWALLNSREFLFVK